MALINSISNPFRFKSLKEHVTEHVKEHVKEHENGKTYNPQRKIFATLTRKSPVHTVSADLLHIYSAFYDNRQPHRYRFGAVRAFGVSNVEKLNEKSELYCELRYKVSKQQVSYAHSTRCVCVCVCVCDLESRC